MGISHAYAKAGDDQNVIWTIGYAGWVRFTPEYRTDGDYSAHYREMASAHAAGLKVLVAGLGDFQGIGSHSLPTAGAGFTAFRNYMKAVLQGQGQTADAVEAWNEPNNPAFAGPSPSASNAAMVTIEMAGAVRDLRLSIPRLSPGLAPHGDLNQPDVWVPQVFFHHMLTGGVAPFFIRSFDVINTHAYAWTNGGNVYDTDIRWNPAKQLIESRNEALFVTHGVTGAFPVAWSEYGAPSSGDTGEPSCDGTHIATQATQLTGYQKADQFWKESYEQAGVPVWGKLAHGDVDDSFDTHCGSPKRMGLLNSDLSGRAAVTEFRNEAARVR